jgi:hypothetical protein
MTDNRELLETCCQFSCQKAGNECDLPRVVEASGVESLSVRGIRSFTNRRSAAQVLGLLYLGVSISIPQGTHPWPRSFRSLRQVLFVKGAPPKSKGVFMSRVTISIQEGTHPWPRNGQRPYGHGPLRTLAQVVFVEGGYPCPCLHLTSWVHTWPWPSVTLAMSYSSYLFSKDSRPNSSNRPRARTVRLRCPVNCDLCSISVR